MSSNIDTIAKSIQLALGPGFLLVAVGSFLNVLTTRLARAVDRARVLHGRVGEPGENEASLREELAVLGRRMRIINIAIMLSVVCALLVCGVIAVIFLASIVDMQVTRVIVGCFVGGMLCMIVALLCLLREIYLATLKTQIRF